MIQLGKQSDTKWELHWDFFSPTIQYSFSFQTSSLVSAQQLMRNTPLSQSETNSFTDRLCYPLSEWACVSLFPFFQRKETLIFNKELSIIFTLWAVIFRWDCQEVSSGKIGKIQGYEPWKEGGWRAESGPCPKKEIGARVSCSQGMGGWRQQGNAKAKDLNLSICGRVTIWMKKACWLHVFRRLLWSERSKGLLSLLDVSGNVF